MSTDFLEIETKYDASDIERIKFKELLISMNPQSFLYIESYDIYYTKSKDEFLRYRMPPTNMDSQRSELTFKKKHTERNNLFRTEVNLRIDNNTKGTVEAFISGLGYKKDFSIYKMCDIYFFEDVNVVFYTVIDENKNSSNFIEIEALEKPGIIEQQAWDSVLRYEKLLSPIGISPHKRKKLSLFELYRSGI